MFLINCLFGIVIFGLKGINVFDNFVNWIKYFFRIVFRLLLVCICIVYYIRYGLIIDNRRDCNGNYRLCVEY